MACGCAVIASRTGFAASLRNGDEALLLEAAAPGNLGRALRELLHDDLLRVRIARGGYDRVQRLRWSSAIATLETCYAQWLNEHREL